MTKTAEQLAAATLQDPRWAAVVARDAKEDGAFFYAVRTTGVYCRPSCAARPARPENIVFFSTTEEAEQAGFRPCMRCKPEQPPLKVQHTALAADLCRLIERSERMPSLAELADHAGLSTFHLHRVFKSVTGVTPRDYAAAHRAERVRTELHRSASVTEAIYDAGYQSSGRFYEEADEMLGMTPTAFRSGGAHMRIRFAVGECSLGSILVAASERGVCAILIDDNPDKLLRDLQDRFPHAELMGGDTEFDRLVSTVVGFVEAPGQNLDLPLDVRGTAFQQRVWQALREIPAGETRSYTDIAKRIGAPKAARAVAQACASNPVAVAIPCHRVVRTDGSLSGYRWGIERKAELLRRERKE